MDSLPPVPTASDAQRMTAQEIAQEEAVLVAKTALETQEIAGQAVLQLLEATLQLGRNIDITV